ncbi:MbtH family NRPS accessory protein [Mycobacterium sp. 852002-51961_SCH5331710]|uniref:MbtH family NRPS accessory protein n=1 Tax=Mycobacterium sp. 852002-51961_SCH5331710 TaxID=1834105 RepID=UPI0007FF8F79|nr:MbtH family NRPS accessory protein [Mycobacterium sp. 852002-51961_SCH5331710]OBB40543.1 protein mbtH [Mycobacterium sp. 852002-51961_SCH5331710]
MNGSPFDDDNRSLLVRVTGEGRHIAWPAFTKGPAGWWVVHGEADRARCLVLIEQNWSDTRPKSPRMRLRSRQA